MTGRRTPRAPTLPASRIFMSTGYRVDYGSAGAQQPIPLNGQSETGKQTLLKRLVSGL